MGVGALTAIVALWYAALRSRMWGWDTAALLVAVVAAMSLALVVIGGGVYRERAWGRVSALLWASCALVVVIAFGVYNVGSLRHSSLVPTAFGRRSVVDGLVVANLCLAPYPVVLLVLLAPKRARALFS